MEGKIMSIEDTRKLANYDKLVAKNTELKSNNIAFENIIKCKNKEIETLRNQIKEQNKLIEELKSNSKQMDIFGG